VNLELTDQEVLCLSYRIMGFGPHSTAEANILLGIFFRLPAVGFAPRVPNVAGSQPVVEDRSAEPRRNLPPSSTPRTPQTVESVRWSTGKFDRESVEQITLTPSKIDCKEGQNGPMLSVMWPARGRGYLYASCFDESLFPWVSARIKQETVFYVTYKGKYTNIVGVKA
jgi:hypothetical protein